MGSLYRTAPQPPENYQEEEPLEEQLLNSSSKGRAKVRNVPSHEKPASNKQLELITVLFEEIDSDIAADLTAAAQEDLSRYDADNLIRELKVLKWRQELYG
jgi:hypothetical protein